MSFDYRARRNVDCDKKIALAETKKRADLGPPLDQIF